MQRTELLPVAVIGAGLIGVDLVTKIERSPYLDCRLVAVRSPQTPGLRQVARLGVPTDTRGFRALELTPEPFAVVFDASNAAVHAEHADWLRTLGVVVIDLTPSNTGRMVAPTLNGLDVLGHPDISMISCGGQASVPILHALTRVHHVDYVEVVTTAASLSVGPSTRLNLDEYIETTQDAVREFTGVPDVKAILNVSPARPPATFRVALRLLGSGFSDESVRACVTAAAARVRSFVPGFAVTACVVADTSVVIVVEVTSSGDRVPRYAGNLDIINLAAVNVAETYAAGRAPLATADAS